MLNSKYLIPSILGVISIFLIAIVVFEVLEMKEYNLFETMFKSK